MAGKMSIFGVGPRFLIGSAAYSAVAVVLQATLFDSRRFTFPGAAVAGAVLVAVGLCVFVSAFAQIRKAYREKRLETRGVYGMCRHPLYAAFIVYVVPGSCLLAGTIPGYTVPIFMYFWFTWLVREEDDWLEREFGEEYSAYRGRVHAVLPWVRPSSTSKSSQERVP